MKAYFCFVTILGLALLAGCAKPKDNSLDARLQEAVTLIAEGKRDQAVRLLDALAVLHPDDARLAKLRAQAAGGADGPVLAPVVSNQAPASVDAGLAEVNRVVQADQSPGALASAGRPAVIAPEDLAGLERVRYESGVQLLREAQAAGMAQPQVRAERMEAFLAHTAALAAARPGLLKLHLQRATAALEVQNREAGLQAVEALLPLGVLQTKDSAQLALLGKLELEGWLAAGQALVEAGPALAELKRLAEAKDFGPAFKARSEEFYTKWKDTPEIMALAVPLVAAAEAATGSDFADWGVRTNGRKAKARVARIERDLAGYALEQGGLELIEPGSFQMGSTKGGSDEQPVTQVTLTQPYWIGKHEVTQRQWREVMGNNPSVIKGDERPVENVSWDDAREFCRKLTEMHRPSGSLPPGHATLPEGYAYRLPTEAEWEYACRAGTTDEYAGPLPAMAWFRDNSGSTTHPVGQKRANARGLHDMHGNVWEWCADWYGRYPGGSVTDPRGADSGTYRVNRGGGWANVAAFCRSAYRDCNSPEVRNSGLGFRVVLSSVR